jgi:hypothetical protein
LRSPQLALPGHSVPLSIARQRGIFAVGAKLALHVVELAMNHNIAERLLDEHRDYAGARPLVDVDGLSSPRVCNFLNDLVRGLEPGESYLEIGTYKGLTLLSAAYKNSGKLCLGCDRFRLLGRFTGLGFVARRELERNVARYRPESATVRLFAMSSRRLFERGLVQGPVGVYFYDGDHSYAGTRHGVTAAAPYLARRSVLLVDDWNDPTIRRATADGLAAAGLRVLWQRELPGNHGPEGWWNGLGVFWLERAPAPPVKER